MPVYACTRVWSTEKIPAPQSSVARPVRYPNRHLLRPHSQAATQQQWRVEADQTKTRKGREKKEAADRYVLTHCMGGPCSLQYTIFCLPFPVARPLIQPAVPPEPSSFSPSQPHLTPCTTPHPHPDLPHTRSLSSLSSSTLLSPRSLFFVLPLYSSLRHRSLNPPKPSTTPVTNSSPFVDYRIQVCARECFSVFPQFRPRRKCSLGLSPRPPLIPPRWASLLFVDGTFSLLGKLALRRLVLASPCFACKPQLSCS